MFFCYLGGGIWEETSEEMHLGGLCEEGRSWIDSGRSLSKQKGAYKLKLFGELYKKSFVQLNLERGSYHAHRFMRKKPAQHRPHLGKSALRHSRGMGMVHRRVQKRSSMAWFNRVITATSSRTTVSGELQERNMGAVFL